MKILGITGGFKRVYESSNGDYHDAAAVLLVDGQVVAAMEEERLTRIKHTDKFPSFAINFVLAKAGLTLKEVDYVCFNGINLLLQSSTGESARKMIADLLFEETGIRIDNSKVHFVHHHLAHAASAYYLCGEPESLIVTIDGQGDEISGMVIAAKNGKFSTLKQFPVENSLGIYYLNIIRVLGYKQFDEYKVMGLAPYGDPSVYRELFSTFYTLLPGGDYTINYNEIRKSHDFVVPRKKGEAFTTQHKNIAAALQESLENIVMHVLGHFKKHSDFQVLCLAGGVAHNCSVNGKVMYSGMFGKVFVQPASHDAGCALGAALFRHYEANKAATMLPRLESVYWGSETPSNESLAVLLEEWKSFIIYERSENLAGQVAKLIADGAVIGWMQGRSEFGPRALGNRSILADPRPGENKARINQMVKMREGYRPFAPAVLAEYAHEIYKLPAGDPEFPFMTFVLQVQDKYQAVLGAVTHVDGSARVQTVSKQSNEKYWSLIHEFSKLSSIPVLLNTSFNNHAEPIVDSAQDAITCFLTTGLDYLVINDYIIRKKETALSALEELCVVIPRHNVLSRTKKHAGYSVMEDTFLLQNNFDNGHSACLSAPAFEVLANADGKQSIGRLIDRLVPGDAEAREKLLGELTELWTDRFISLFPSSIKTS